MVRRQIPAANRFFFGIRIAQKSRRAAFLIGFISSGVGQMLTRCNARLSLSALTVSDSAGPFDKLKVIVLMVKYGAKARSRTA